MAGAIAALAIPSKRRRQPDLLEELELDSPDPSGRVPPRLVAGCAARWAALLFARPDAFLEGVRCVDALHGALPDAGRADGSGSLPQATHLDLGRDAGERPRARVQVPSRLVRG